ncbi:MAG TPA: AIR carboxylase family protein [Candidatus Saccharimonadia bacterium]|nr:AIR carboxylase family protein [Candidatus Saccharimonadia bacterium]
MTLVHIVLGSASDLEAVKAAGMTQTLDTIGISSAVSVCSAHRNLEELGTFATEAVQNGAQVFIGVAGMATALPGALAGLTTMAKPIIGVPLDEHGIDSCIYMPPGVPVLTAGVGKSGLKNAAIATAQILAVNDPAITEGLATFLAASKKQPQFDIKEGSK